jgi:hypothetical protein
MIIHYHVSPHCFFIDEFFKVGFSVWSYDWFNRGFCYLLGIEELWGLWKVSCSHKLLHSFHLDAGKCILAIDGDMPIYPLQYIGILTWTCELIISIQFRFLAGILHLVKIINVSFLCPGSLFSEYQSGLCDKIAKFYLLADLDKIRVRHKSSTLQVSKGRSLSNTHFFLSSLGRLILAKKKKV